MAPVLHGTMGEVRVMVGGRVRFSVKGEWEGFGVWLGGVVVFFGLLALF